MTDKNEFDEFLDNLVEQHGDPRLIEKFGDPRDKNDPRNWTPTKRIEEGLSTEEQLKLLGLDIEMLTISMSQLMRWKLDEQAKAMYAEFQRDPEAAIRKMLGGKGTGSYGPLGNSPDEPIRYAGSVDDTIKADDIVETPDGPIRADQIPGYQPIPGWKPSPDWAEANCMCPAHQAARAESEGRRPDDDFPNGMYL